MFRPVHAVFAARVFVSQVCKSVGRIIEARRLAGDQHSESQPLLHPQGFFCAESARQEGRGQPSLPERPLRTVRGGQGAMRRWRRHQRLLRLTDTAAAPSAETTSSSGTCTTMSSHGSSG